MYWYAQRGFFAREAGGQLFSHAVHHQLVQVTHISGPNPETVAQDTDSIGILRKPTQIELLTLHTGAIRSVCGIPIQKPLPRHQDKMN
jgi:hypothetical protein